MKGGRNVVGRWMKCNISRNWFCFQATLDNAPRDHAQWWSKNSLLEIEPRPLACPLPEVYLVLDSTKHLICVSNYLVIH